MDNIKFKEGSTPDYIADVHKCCTWLETHCTFCSFKSFALVLAEETKSIVSIHDGVATFQYVGC